jgi:hypothetical protein
VPEKDDLPPALEPNVYTTGIAWADVYDDASRDDEPLDEWDEREEVEALEDAGVIARLGESAAEAAERAYRREAGEETEDGFRTRDIPNVRPSSRVVERTPPSRSDTYAPDLHPSPGDLARFEEVFGEVGGAQVVGGHEDMSAEPATRWLREHDPQRTLDGVTREIEAAAEAAGLGLDGFRAAMPSSGGRPSKARQELRSKLRDALMPIYEDGRSRTLMAEALGCSRPTLDRLMRPTG